MTDNDMIEMRVLIQNLLGMPEYSVRPADDNQPIDGSDIAIVQVSDMETQGWSGSGIGALQACIATLTIDFMGDMAATHARQLDLAMQSRYAVDTLLTLNMGYLSCDTARDLTALEIERVKRYQVKMRLSYATAYDMPTTIPPDYQIEHEITSVPIGLIAEP